MQPRKIIFLLFGFFLLVFIYRWGWYNDIARSVLRYQETGLNSHFSYPASQPFSAYINTTEMMVKNARRQGGVDDSKQTVLENSPHRLLPHSAICKKESNGKYKKGILFIHGFLDSPYSFRALANFFQDKCFVVYQVLLPGHGTVPGDLLTVQYQDWTAAVDYAILQLSREVNNIYLTGFSLGGLLATNVAVQRPNTFKALILLSPLFKFKFKFPAAIPLVNSLSHWIPRLRWLNYADDSVQVRYISYPVNAVYQIKKLLDRVNKKLAINKISLPLFIMQSAEDQTVDADAVLTFFAKNNHPKSHLMWFTQEGLNKPREEERITSINSTLLAQKILSMSHLSFSLPASDPIYGRDGQYRDCQIYPAKTTNWSICKNDKNIFLGEVTENNLQRHIVRRLTFNPFYFDMMKQLNTFLDAL